jgi:hypothetical protein
MEALLVKEATGGHGHAAPSQRAAARLSCMGLDTADLIREMRREEG